MTAPIMQEVERCGHGNFPQHCWAGVCRQEFAKSQQAEIDRLRGLMDELHDYAAQHDSWRCAHYGDCRCGLDALFDKCGWERIPCKGR